MATAINNPKPNRGSSSAPSSLHFQSPKPSTTVNTTINPPSSHPLQSELVPPFSLLPKSKSLINLSPLPYRSSHFITMLCPHPCLHRRFNQPNLTKVLLPYLRHHHHHNRNNNSEPASISS
ncbi:hypothetical protein M0R45_035911 [Rubus argutus]|uniref:Uncharacterized protein n=1 Tax=Rubus argutus TaxID=59490 RepID=A0AAW1VZ21_RUBAR